MSLNKHTILSLLLSSESMLLRRSTLFHRIGPFRKPNAPNQKKHPILQQARFASRFQRLLMICWVFFFHIMRNCAHLPLLIASVALCVHPKRPRVCRQHAHMRFNMCACCRYTRGRFECTHEKAFGVNTRGVITSSAYQEKPTKSSHLAPQVHQK